MFQVTKALNAPLSKYVRATLLISFAFVIFVSAVQSINGATYTVTNTLDSGAGSLRQAVLDANATAANDAIVFNIPAASCDAVTGVCTIAIVTVIQATNNGSLTITGTGADRLIISGGGVTGVFSSAAVFTVSGVTITGGLSSGGGGVLVSGGTATIRGVVFANNTATSSRGGGIYFTGGTNHRIENSTFSGNTTTGSNGGAIATSVDLTVINTTISGNSAVSFGGGIHNDGGTLTLRNCTITGNTAVGGGIFIQAGLNIGNTIIAGNNNTSTPDDVAVFGGTSTTTGYNLIGANLNSASEFPTGNPNANKDLVGGAGSRIDAQLAPLANNGGTTPTHALCTAAGVPDASCTDASPAIDKGSLAAGVATDGRGVIRPYDIFATTNATGGNGSDIGAFELNPTSEFGWGLNTLGQVGDGTTTSRSLPTAMAGGFTDIISIEGGSSHALGLRSNGTLVAWGNNDRGQLGDGMTTTNRSFPAAVTGLTNVVAVAGGANHSLAVLTDGTVMAWGSNINGQLGNQGPFNPTPAAVNGITNAVAVAAVANTSYALLADGSVVAWGRNSSGQLGDGTTTPRSTPGQVSGLTSGVVSIEGGGNSCYAVLSDGSVRAWGNNSSGQLGDGTTTNGLTPVTPLNLTSGVVQIAGGFFHAAALKADGTLLTWGGNAEGELGDGTTTNNSTPTAIALANVTQIRSNLGSLTYARLRDGSLYAWGANNFGSVGNGTTATAQSTPTRVSVDTGIGFFGANGNGGYAGSPLVSVAAGANQFFRIGDGNVTFPNVSTAGTLQISTFDPTATGLTVPSGYTILANSRGYDLTTTASFTGTATVCLQTPTFISQNSFDLLYVLHDDDGDGTLDAQLVSSRNYPKREICRTTRSFSPFVLASGPPAPTAANVSVSGRIMTNDGFGLRNAVVTLTGSDCVTRRATSSSFGYYSFDDVMAGESYVMGVASKRYQFATRIVTVVDQLTDVDFVSDAEVVFNRRR